MRLLFWNTHMNENINSYIASLVKDNDIDTLVLSEYNADKEELSRLLNSNNCYLDECNTIGCDRISVWSSYIKVKSGSQQKYYSIQVINDEFILCGVHFISDLHGDRSDERLAIAQTIMHEIIEQEKKAKIQCTIIIGDINEMPYERGCLNANGFHGLPVLGISDKPTRKVNDIEYRKFYNPMWNLLGDFSYPPGTYYLNQSKLRSPMWYIFDQVIISQDVIPLFVKEQLKIITSCRYGDLMDKSGHPDQEISDHFPIMCEIRDKKRCERVEFNE